MPNYGEIRVSYFVKLVRATLVNYECLVYGEATRLESSINHLKDSRECYMKNKLRGTRPRC